MSRKADPRCPLCAGKGGSRYGTRWVKCECVNGTAAQRAAVRRLHSTGALRDPTRSLLDDGHEQLSLMESEGSTSDTGAATTDGPTHANEIRAETDRTRHKRFCVCFDCQEARFGTDGAMRYFGWQSPSTTKPRPTKGTGG